MVASIVIWALGYYPNHDEYESVTEQQENSYIGRIGKAMEPVIELLGFDWKLGIGILSGLFIPKLMNVRGNQVCAALTASAPMLIAGLGMLLLPHLMPVWAFVRASPRWQPLKGSRAVGSGPCLRGFILLRWPG